MPEQSALAATAPAHDYKRLATVNVKRDVIEYRAVSEFPNEIGNLDDDFSISVHD
jgi:hypothetical protein